ncbi:MAG: nuclear transport factor 2 family protein, partial [Chloroflexota bacterium]
MDDRAQIAETNRNFYRAMRTGDMRLMEQVWLHADWVGCVHPGWPLLVGWPNIRHSWTQIFAGGQSLHIMPSQVVMHIEKDLAWVTCVENITAHEENAWQHSVATATNLFQRANDEWRMIHHHASAMPPPEA